ncbi:hypothetical protein L484_022216 [Morus notabilis]|uniref:B-like cyclin n=1 Tax=Morus notabilis TaxID=981085 RepID=W9RNH6_9ROSA|nr:hypothetical protein L484_022216 [Morus notabilis]
MEFDLENPLTDSDDLYSDSVASLFLVESDHMPSDNYFSSLQAGDFDVLVRREAISSISQFSCNFDPFLSYLAVNYLDRFLSSHGMLQPKQWVIKLLSISCVSLAAKMKDTEFSLTDFQILTSWFISPQYSLHQRFSVLLMSCFLYNIHALEKQFPTAHENISKCFNAMQDVLLEEYEPLYGVISSSVTPVNVLDQRFSSSESGNGTTSLRLERDMIKFLEENQSLIR